MKKTCILICAFVTASCFLSCKKKNASFPIEFQLKLLNSQGHETAVFNQTDTIIFELLIINHTDEEIHLDNFVPDLICNSDTYLRIYSDKGTNFGRPCMPVCTDEGIFILQTSQTRKLQIKWPSSINTCQTKALPVGNYTTNSSYTFTIEGGKYDGQHSAQLLNSKFSVN